ncbi:NAD(P)-dependent oxidoreductase [Arachidicoccus soli]|uniref:NAD-dependent epimerase/dehydratase family protein n=1 Tax=Arachidicoccus soli TaxID=2341117 RepID=A0A386HKV6_9BACT|nr:NAD(P)H-binding protein [Arachidicoccus soli]AYD46527.1 NAD-dependent epimerase/dehydratase family protein [Arachidicoccus soli]
MKVALIGASGFVGRAILNELLNRNHTVNAILRHPEKLSLRHKNLFIHKANVFNEKELIDSVSNNDAVISAYNAGWTNPNLYNDFLEGSKTIQAGVKKSGVQRLIVIGGAGSLYISDGLQLVDTPEFPAEYKTGAQSARDYLKLLQNEKVLNWTFFSPAIEMHAGTSGKRTGKYRTGLENPVFDENGRSILSVEDLALAIVDELENPKNIGRRFTAAY